MTGAGTPDDARWRRLNDLFEQALTRPVGERAAFIAASAASDPDLRAELESLLAAHDDEPDFLERPAAGASAAPARAPSESERSAAHLTDLAGTDIGPYRIRSLLGRGGMGVVYLADDVRLGRPVAIKAVAPEHVDDPARRDRLRREARAAAALTHPGIAAVYALEELDNRLFIVGEYVPGPTLRHEMAAAPPRAANVLATGIDLADALAAAHERGIVHRDLKPENAIRAPDGRVKILDFGLARFRQAGEATLVTEHDRALGTPGYMAPEQIRRDPVDARADVFALGIVLFELLTGRHPFDAADSASTLARILQDEPRGWPATTDGVGAALTAVIARCLEKDPARRFASGREVLAALHAARAGEPIERLPGAEITRARGWWAIHQWITSGAYAALLIPVWMAKAPIGGRNGLTFFLFAAVAIVAALVLRLHRLFTASSLPAEWADQRARTGPWLTTADVVLSVALVTGAVLLPEDRAELAAVLAGAGVAVLLASLVIEPATTRAAFDRRDRGQPSPQA